jgi:hypothetical protein
MWAIAIKLYKVLCRMRISSIMTEPTQVPQATDPKMGFNTYAERLNGRAAMIGFILAVAIQLFTGKGLLAWLGLINP